MKRKKKNVSKVYSMHAYIAFTLIKYIDSEGKDEGGNEKRKK